MSRAPETDPPDMDRSWLDFTPDEACDLAKRLAPLTSTIDFEVRPHGQAEHTFRVACRPLGNDDNLHNFAALESVGVRTIFDADGKVRLGHLNWPIEPPPGLPAISK